MICPEVAAVTNVAMDHADFLGDTLVQIAREKAGIMKAGVPFVTAEQDPELRAVFEEVARERGAPVSYVEQDAVQDVVVRPDQTSFRTRTSAWGELELARRWSGDTRRPTRPSPWRCSIIFRSDTAPPGARWSKGSRGSSTTAATSSSASTT